MEVGGHRKIGRPELRWSDVIRKDTKYKQVNIEEAQGMINKLCHMIDK